MALICWGLVSQPYKTLNWLCVQCKSVHAQSGCLWVYFYSPFDMVLAIYQVMLLQTHTPLSLLNDGQLYLI